MIKLTETMLWVRDQDEALAFYTGKLGFELRGDVTMPEMNNFRWLTVGPVGQPDVALMLQPIHPRLDPETLEQLRSLMAKGRLGTLFLTTDDCYGDYEELTSRGVEFTEPPEERPFGIDSAFRDPSGTQIRMTEHREPAG